MKSLSAFLAALISVSTSALAVEPSGFQGLSSNDQAAACQVWFLGNVNYLLQRAEVAGDSAERRDMTRRAYPVAGMAILAGQSSGRTVAGTSDRLRSLGEFEPGSSRREVGTFCMMMFWPTYIKYSKDSVFMTEVVKLVQSSAHEQYLAAGGIPKYAQQPILAAGVKGVLLGTPAADAERQFLSAYPGSKIKCLALMGVPHGLHCHVTPQAGSELSYADLPAADVLYYIYENRVAGFGVAFASINAKLAFHTLEANLRTLTPMEPRVERQPDGKTSTLSWQSGQETLLLQTEEDDGTYLTYAVQSFLTRMTKASMPALQSEKGM